MTDRSPLEYEPVPPPRRRPPGRDLAVASLLVLPVLVYLLFELQRAPYAPPADISTLLNDEGNTLVRLVMAVLAAVWCVCLTGLAAAMGRESVTRSRS
jgi:hypothetical protein